MRGLPSGGMCQEMCNGCCLPAVSPVQSQQRLGVLHAADMDHSRCIVFALRGQSLKGMAVNVSVIAATCLWRAKHCQHPERPETLIKSYSERAL